jgi:hypothetical protein
MGVGITYPFDESMFANFGYSPGRVVEVVVVGGGGICVDANCVVVVVVVVVDADDASASASAPSDTTILGTSR